MHARYVEKWRPWWNLWENVDAIGESTSDADETYVTDLQAMCSMIADKGFFVSFSLVNSARFYLPQNRWRYWILAIPLEMIIAPHVAHFDFQNSCADLLALLQGDGIALGDVLLDDNDPLVLEALAKATTLRNQNRDADMRKVSGWRTEHPLEFAKLGLRYGVYQAPEKVRQSP